MVFLKVNATDSISKLTYYFVAKDMESAEVRPEKKLLDQEDRQKIFINNFIFDTVKIESVKEVDQQEVKDMTEKYKFALLDLAVGLIEKGCADLMIVGSVII